MESFITSPNKLLDQIWNDKNIHIVQKENKLDKDLFRLIDISLKAHGKDQDQQYVRSSFYRNNIRRGNTLIRNSNNKLQWGRKGTPKTLDIQLEYLESYLRKVQLSKKEAQIRDAIFDNVLRAFKKGKKVQLIKTQKANGENAQVSYNYDYNAWIICSKNVSILARNRKDLKNYSQQRYTYANLIADAWFDLIEHLKADQKLKLKQTLDGFTIIGEYCGNPLYQHLVRYDSIHLRWFAMVDNISQKFCEDPFYVQKELTKFGFTFVKVKNMGTFTNIQGFMETLSELYLKTASAGIEDAQFGMEGSIVYFVQLDMIDKKAISIPIGAAKLKTLEYRFFRKIRQKLSRFRQRRQNEIQVMRKFENQCQDLERSSRSRVPFPHEYYKKILKTGFQIIKSVEISDDFLRGRFIDVIKLIFYINHKRLSIETYIEAMLSDEFFIRKISQIQFARYGGLGCQTKVIYIAHGLPGIFNKYFGAKIEPHFSKMKLKYKQISHQSISQESLDQKQAFLKFLDKVISQINQQGQKTQNVKQKPSLNNYFIDGCFSPEQLGFIINKIRDQGREDVFHKVILIKDKVITKFEEGYNQYPFNLETIAMSYHVTYQKHQNLNTLKEKIDHLKKVTEILKKSANFDESKLGVQCYYYPFSNNTKLKDSQEISNLVQGIISNQDNYKLYQRLLVKLQNILDVKYLSEQQIEDHIKLLIKSSFPSIERVNFKQK